MWNSQNTYGFSLNRTHFHLIFFCLKCSFSFFFILYTCLIYFKVWHFFLKDGFYQISWSASKYDFWQGGGGLDNVDKVFFVEFRHFLILFGLFYCIFSGGLFTYYVRQKWGGWDPPSPPCQLEIRNWLTPLPPLSEKIINWLTPLPLVRNHILTHSN